MYAYPPSFPVEEVQLFAPLLRGQVPAAPEAVQAGWVIVGYGLSKGLPVTPLNSPRVSYSYGYDTAAAHLEMLATDSLGGTVTPHSLSAVPWRQLIRIILTLLQSYAG